MKISKPLIFLLGWWFFLSVVWGLYRLLPMPEAFSELVAKPLVWIGSIWLGWKLKVIPESVFADMKSHYLQTQPVWRIFILPGIFTMVYFGLINARLIEFNHFSLLTLIIALIINFATGAVEELTYRGVLYVWLLSKTNEVVAFFMVQLLFTLGHLPILILNSESLTSALNHTFFIVLLSSIYTALFRINKSLYSTMLAHGIWNSMVYYLLLR